MTLRFQSRNSHLYHPSESPETVQTTMKKYAIVDLAGYLFKKNFDKLNSFEISCGIQRFYSFTKMTMSLKKPTVNQHQFLKKSEIF